MNEYLQPFKRGRASSEGSVIEILNPLVEVIAQERTQLSFSPTVRGWCYLLEGLGVCTKGDFANVQSRITRARKMGLLPLDITAEDETRSTTGGGYISRPLNELILTAIDDVRYCYSSCVIEQFTGVHIELVVEKLDLVGLLKSVTSKYQIPVTCSRGWSDLHLRANLINRCFRYEMPTVVLMFGDHDPGGLSITDAFKDNLEELLPAMRVAHLPKMEFVRIGLNQEDIDRLGLVWIDGLETSSGEDLASPKHKLHKSQPVQDYLKNFGAKKCEANALLRTPKAAEDILQTAIDEIIDFDDFMEFKDARQQDKASAIKAIEAVKAAIP